MGAAQSGSGQVEGAAAGKEEDRRRSKSGQVEGAAAGKEEGRERSKYSEEREQHRQRTAMVRRYQAEMYSSTTDPDPPEVRQRRLQFCTALLPTFHASTRLWETDSSSIGFQIAVTSRSSDYDYLLAEVAQGKPQIHDRLSQLEGCTSCDVLAHVQLLHVHASGSSAEGFDLPEKMGASDSDKMYEWGPVDILPGYAPAWPGPDPAAGQRGRRQLPPVLRVTQTANPGYLLLERRLEPGCQHGQPLCFSADSLRKLMLVVVQGDKGGGKAFVSGPSVTGVFLATHGGVTHENDFVGCIRWRHWPSPEFAERNRPANWPTPKQVSDMMSYGTHMVPVGVRGSPTHEVEWRLSYSRAEQMLGLSVNPCQRLCLLLAKALKKFAMPPGGQSVLKTYHLKTSLFWMCEKIPGDAWTEETVWERLFDMLNFLIECATACVLPQFFNTSINLFSLFAPEAVQELCDAFRALRARALHFFPDVYVHLSLLEKRVAHLPDAGRLAASYVSGELTSTRLDAALSRCYTITGLGLNLQLALVTHIKPIAWFLLHHLAPVHGAPAGGLHPTGTALLVRALRLTPAGTRLTTRQDAAGHRYYRLSAPALFPPSLLQEAPQEENHVAIESEMFAVMRRTLCRQLTEPDATMKSLFGPDVLRPPEQHTSVTLQAIFSHPRLIEVLVDPPSMRALTEKHQKIFPIHKRDLGKVLGRRHQPAPWFRS